MTWLIVLGLVVILGLVLYWQFILAEGAYLGTSLVALLYDLTAERYNRIKEFDEVGEDLTLGQPLINRLYNQPGAVVLDVATGTGRVPLALLRQPTYYGHIIALDRASRMLAVARRDTANHRDRVSLVQGDAMALPFANNSLPLVACLETLEFLPNPERGLGQLIRVLQAPSAANIHRGWLVTTNRVGWEARLMPGKTWTRQRFNEILSDMPLKQIEVRVWQDIYDLAWAQKKERSDETGANCSQSTVD